MPLLENDRWGAVCAFEAIGRRLSFVEAARELGISASALSRRISQLEDRLGARLLHRTTRHVTLTEAGVLYLHRCRALIEQAEDMDAQAASQSIRPTGTLRVALPNLYGQLRIAPLLPAFFEQQPMLRFQLLLSDRYLDMVAERIDVAVRIGNLVDGDYVARRLTTNVRHLCAAPDYIARRGHPDSPRALSDHACLHFSPMVDGRIWRLRQGEKEVEVPIRPLISSDNAEVLRQSALAGSGISLLADFVVGADIAAGRLVRVLNDWQAAPSSVYIAYPAARYLPLKSRALIDYLTSVIQ